jgi:GDP-L-fucose synthase
MHLSSGDEKIYVAGHTGLVGSAVVRALHREGFSNQVVRTSQELDLRHQGLVLDFFEKEKPEFVVLAAARVGGILANDTYPADFLADNLAIELNVIQAARHVGVKRLLFLGSSCVFPKHAPQPLREDMLLTAPLEPTNEWYAVAKIAGIKLCQAFNRQYGTDYVTLMPTNVYGPGDNFDLATSHVLPALIRKFHEAKGAEDTDADRPVTLWGTGTPRREFIHSDDLGEACVFVLKTPATRIARVAPDWMLNVGAGVDLEIRELAHVIRDVVGSRSEITFDSSKPDGTPRKLLDVGRMASLGWTAKTSLQKGLEMTYDWYQAHH